MMDRCLQKKLYDAVHRSDFKPITFNIGYIKYLFKWFVVVTLFGSDNSSVLILNKA